MQPKQYFVYFLALDLDQGQHAKGQQTYIGATVDLDHRLRQHNKEIKGGAHATSAQVAQGLQWKRVCHVRGFPTWQAALQFEWRWKQLSRKQPANKSPIDRRLDALQDLLNMERSTSKAVPYDEWPTPPEVVMS
jgi:structure-specific endonuclease subunit SLX1